MHLNQEHASQPTECTQLSSPHYTPNNTAHIVRTIRDEGPKARETSLEITLWNNRFFDGRQYITMTTTESDSGSAATQVAFANIMTRSFVVCQFKCASNRLRKFKINKPTTGSVSMSQ